jgi:hypothetical protein
MQRLFYAFWADFAAQGVFFKASAAGITERRNIFFDFIPAFKADNIIYRRLIFKRAFANNADCRVNHIHDGS